MKKVGIVLVVIFVALGIFALSRASTTTPPKIEIIPSPSASLAPKEVVDTKASFKIITGNITRSFTAEKYHNQSEDVFIQADDPTIIHVKKAGITWDDFFQTLPMKLTKTCLTTGDGENLCDGEGGNLRFYLNNIEDKDLLDKEIMMGDEALITFK